MVTNLEQLINLCDDELKQREYSHGYYLRIHNTWKKLKEWCVGQGITEFTEIVGNNFCDIHYGCHLTPVRCAIPLREKIRAIRMLISYQKSETFEFRCPRKVYEFNDALGTIATAYLDICKNERQNSRKTLDNKRFYLDSFCKYLSDRQLGVADLSIDLIEKFFADMNYSLASRHNAASTIRLFLKYVFDIHASDQDKSICVLPDTYKKHCKLPTTYEEDEIKELLSAAERGSAIGKRDYLIMLLAAEYGWRAGDITSFCFDDIDWDKNVIRFGQNKTDVPVEFPLLASVGNALIDYLKNGRPKTDAVQIIVSAENCNKGKPLASSTVHSVVTKYFRRSGIKGWKNKKHGPHAMRHSLATNLLKKNVAMPVISTVLGHQNTDTTSIYISLDYDKLRQCVLPMPQLYSSYYNKEGHHGKI